MASGNLLAQFFPAQNEYTGSNPATPDVRNGRPCLDFDTTTQEIAVFSAIMPDCYTAAANIVVTIEHAATSAETGTIGWDVTLERNPDGTTLTSDGWATAKVVTAATVPGTAGISDIVTVTLTGGATDTDSVAAGDHFRVRLRRNVSADDAAGDAEFYSMRLNEA